MQRIAIRQSDRIIRERKRQVLTWSILIAIFMVFSYTFVWQRVKTLELAEQHSQLQRNVNDLKAKCRSFEYDINQLSSVQRIDQIARMGLSMMPADQALLAAATFTPGKSSPKPPIEAVVKTKKDTLLAVSSKPAAKNSPKPVEVASKDAKKASVDASSTKKGGETRLDKKSADVIVVKQEPKKESKAGSSAKLKSSGSEGVLLASATQATIPELMSSYDPSAMPVAKRAAQASKKSALKSSGKSTAKSTAKPVSSGSKGSSKNNGKSSPKNSVASSKTKSAPKNGKVAG